MKHLIMRILSCCVAVLLLLPMFPAIPAQAVPVEYSGEGFRDLQKEEHRIAYGMIEQAVAGLSPTVTFENVVQINYKEMCKVIHAVAVDYPQYFWYTEGGRFTYDTRTGNYIVSFEPEYLLDGQRVSIASQTLLEAQSEFHHMVQEIVMGIPANYTTDYQIALYLHDYLADHITYTLEGDHPSAYAALIHGQAACYGYSKAYQCLLNAAGVRARTITGDSPDEDGKLIGHAWNQVWLNGHCYYVDVTWDDYEEVIMHEYFAMSLEEISQDHFADAEFILPECHHDPVVYHAISEGPGVANITTFTSVSDAAACFRLESLEGGKAVFGCEMRFSGGDFFQWFSSHYSDLCRKMGLSVKTEAYYYQQNNVYYITLIDPYFSGKMPVISEISLSQDSVVLPNPGAQFLLQPKVTGDLTYWPQLQFRSSDPDVITVGDKGLVTAVCEGSALVTIATPDGVELAQCTFQVLSAPKHQHTMRLFVRTMATCTQDGHEDYYLCLGCGCRFADECGVTEYTHMESFVLPAIGHAEVSWVKYFDYHQQECKCGDVVEGSKAVHEDMNQDEVCDVCAAPMHQSENKQKHDNTEKNFPLGWVIGFAAATGLAIVVWIVIRKRIRGY